MEPTVAKHEGNEGEKPPAESNNKRPLTDVAESDSPAAITKLPKQNGVVADNGDGASSLNAAQVLKKQTVEDDNQDKKAPASTSDNNKETNGAEEEEDTDRTSKDYYFDSYSHHAIHEEMLKDEVRTRTYEMAIKQNPHLFEGKIVLDVGCGTGVLSMFAAQTGAKHVYAVDCSSIIDQAKAIVKLNKFDDKITLIQGKIEEIELPVPKVDVVLSEWMGYCLLYESMLDSVLFARDKWLVPNGVVFPDKAVLYLAAIEDGQVKRERIDFWDDVYGFDMSPIKEIAIKEPVVDMVDSKALLTDSVPVLTLDILTCTKDDLDFKNPFRLKTQRNDYIHGLVAYFECAFTQVHKPVGFSTAPFARYTHWKQTIFYLEETLTVCEGEALEGEFSCKPNKKNKRDLDIIISLSFDGRFSQFKKEGIKYRLR